VPAEWSVVGTADLNQDGYGDLLWYDSVTGAVAVWFMNGSTVTSSTTLGTVAPGLNWKILGAGNEGQGAGILWYNTSSGDVTVWMIKNGVMTGSNDFGAVPPATGWSIQGIGDFDGDGNVDILWHNISTGGTAIWFINNNQITSSASLGNIPTIWSIDQIGDYDGNGKSDILWVDNTGNVSIWFMNGSTVASSANLGNVGTTWQPQYTNANN
jgi:hypothetical protein